MMAAEALSGGVWHVELRRPEKRNALGVEAYMLLADMLRQIGSMPDARAVVLSGPRRGLLCWQRPCRVRDILAAAARRPGGAFP